MKPLRLLLVDDDELDRMAVQRMLRGSELHASIVEAGDAAAAIEALLAGSFDCVLLDFHLPRLDGLDVLRRVRAMGIDTPVIMLTGQGDEALAVELMKAGASDYVAKANLSAQRLGTGILAALKLYEAQQAASKAQELLRQQVQFAEMFVGIASHDLRNPLSVIMLNVAILERSAKLPPELQQCVARIKTSGKKSLRLIHDLLDFTQARLGSGIPINRASTDLHALVSEAVEELRSTHPGRELVLRLSGDGAGIWDADRLAQVVTNLVTNALAYGAPDRPVTVDVGGNEDGVGLSVHNEGEPIPGELRDTLFEPLRRGALRQGAPVGNIGLGLFIVDQIARAHGGGVDVESSASAGTRFTVRLPRTPADT
ncbi:hybrid sensor histidine kinase/response regulator [Azohydromonas caseinilytica]|uniref:histidine kinase n=1 Tax=Azohydromonas caseinilytica TaxID=2728836 RepID=A0A848F913_9BURK|nr:hybrid sensor histidine kinase/response regulator [Azohydromonas caseinilytica]NML15738.1 hybrid sensor histidine kinase/response regulator [Azohydromonas caseinilytica]